MQIAILGKGRMGMLLHNLIKQQGHEVIGFIDENNYQMLATACQVVFDFSNAARLPLLCRFLELSRCRAVVGTTGYTTNDFELLKQFGKSHAICYSSNYSIGILLLNQMIEYGMPYLFKDYNIEITEVHHRFKQDAPSGTSQLLLDTIKEFYPYKEVYGRAGMLGGREYEEIGVHSLRGGNISGEHNIYFMGNDEELVLTHKAYSREVYGRGVIKAMDLLLSKDNGFYLFKNLLFKEEKA